MPLEHPFVVVATACLISAAFLWLGAEAGAEARYQSRPVFWGLSVAGAVLVGCGVWWPGHVMPAPDLWNASAGHEPLYAWSLALAWALSGIGMATCARQKDLPAFGAIAVGGAVLAYVHGMVITPQMFRLVWAASLGGPGPLLLLLTSSLVTIHVVHNRSGIVRAVRGCAVMITAVVLSLVAAASVPPASAQPLPVLREPAGGRPARARHAAAVRREADGGRRIIVASAVGACGDLPGQPDPAADARLLRDEARCGRAGVLFEAPGAGPVVHRPRRLQAGQRHLRPQLRRPGAASRSASACGPCPCRRCGSRASAATNSSSRDGSAGQEGGARNGQRLIEA